MPKIQNLKFYTSFNTFGRDTPTPPQRVMNFGEQIGCILWEEMSFETLTPIWSHVNEKKKSPKFKISQFFEQLW